ncbi:unnamed protein product [Haemonchus placei]|uniref:DUF1931 domain-containing protein n=1 Tax=Haemonchus placei TaxID=6290 RepID=A0A0N4WL39_HAEPC|nr:unnamed protein product [Haemonchus placei]
MLRSTCAWTLRTGSEPTKGERRAFTQIAPVQLKVREATESSIREAVEFKAQGERPRRSPKTRWRDVVKKDLGAKLMAEDAAIEGREAADKKS